MKPENISDDSVKRLDELWMESQQPFMQIKNIGKNFIQDARKVIINPCNNVD